MGVKFQTLFSDTNKINKTRKNRSKKKKEKRGCESFFFEFIKLCLQNKEVVQCYHYHSNPPHILDP